MVNNNSSRHTRTFVLLPTSTKLPFYSSRRPRHAPFIRTRTQRIFKDLHNILYRTIKLSIILIHSTKFLLLLLSRSPSIIPQRSPATTLTYARILLATRIAFSKVVKQIGMSPSLRPRLRFNRIFTLRTQIGFIPSRWRNLRSMDWV